MGLRIDQLVARVEDPANPVVWLDPSLGAGLWAALPEALTARAFLVRVLEQVESVAALPGRAELEALPVQEGGQGWAILFPEPELLREADEAGFEDWLEMASQVHEMHWAGRRTHLKVVVRD
jgi:hypothetical protein